MYYLTSQVVWAINRRLLEEEGQLSALRDRSALESAVMRPQNAAYYEQADGIEQAGLLITGIAQAHSFLDGNKRTAVLAGVLFLRRNGYLLDVSSNEAELGGKLVEIINHHISFEDFMSWLRQHIHKQP